jgi:hypothetical protein
LEKAKSPFPCSLCPQLKSVTAASVQFSAGHKKTAEKKEWEKDFQSSAFCCLAAAAELSDISKDTISLLRRMKTVASVIHRITLKVCFEILLINYGQYRLLKKHSIEER